MAKYNKGDYKYDIDHPVAASIIPEMLPGEIFQTIPDRAAPDVLPYYAISNYGRIWHIYENKFIATSWDGPGYRIAVLRTKNDGCPRTYRVHRILMLTFRYEEYLKMQAENPGCDIVVDHRDCSKTRNYIDFPGYEDNLRWSTQSDNMKYAHETGVKKALCGEDHPNSTYKETQVRAVCQMIQDTGLTSKQIAEINDVSLGFVENIRFGKTWKQIACEYDFSRVRNDR